VRGGAVVAASFQGFEQAWLVDCLARLGPGWVGVAQIPAGITDAEIARLAALGVRALRFNLFRGRFRDLHEIVSLAERAHALAGWHAELYADAAELAPHVPRLARLPQLVIDHLGMSEAGQPVLLELVAAGAKVKASGFGRVQLDVERALERIARASPAALVFGTDLPSTRAARPFEPGDVARLARALGPELARRALWDNALELYRIPSPDLAPRW
jgi:predicted TIM-barrel fold metal-dependent hydrolase